MSDAAASSSASAGFLRRMLRPLIGDIRWQAPGWLCGIGNALGFCAIALAIDGAELVYGATNGLGALNNSAVPSSSRHHTDVHRKGFRYSLTEAKRLLKEANYAGQPIKIITNTKYGSMYDTALIAQGLAWSAGIRLQVEVLDWATQLDRYTRGDYQMMAFSYSSRLDPVLTYDMLVGDKKTQPQKVWNSPSAIKKVAELKREPDTARRQRGLDELHTQMLQEIPILVLWNGPMIPAFGKQVMGYRNWEHARFWNVRIQR